MSGVVGGWGREEAVTQGAPGAYRIEPLTDDIAERAGQFEDAFPGDPADRMIAATALVRGVPLVTHDEMLRGAEQVKTLW